MMSMKIGRSQPITAAPSRNLGTIDAAIPSRPAMDELIAQNVEAIKDHR